MTPAVMARASGTSGEKEFLDELIDHAHFLPSGEPGVYGRGMIFEDVRNRIGHECDPFLLRTAHFR